MELQEYHVKHLFKSAGLPVLRGEVAYTPQEAGAIARKFGKGPYFLKAQIMGNGRCYGRLLQEGCMVDGCAYVAEANDVAKVSQDLFGHPSWLKNTNDLFEVQKVYVEKGIVDATVLGCFVFRVNFEKQCEMFTVMSGQNGCYSVVLKEGLTESVLDKVVKTLKILDEKAKKSMFTLLKRAYRLFKHFGAVAVEISPVVQLKDGSLKIIDGRLVFDPNTTSKFPELVPLIESRVGKEREKLARQNHFRYMGMNGNIACVVNGIGLGWATVDLIQRKGGRAASLLDVGTEPTKETVTKALRLVLSEPNVDAVLVNIFGGVTRCDLIAEGLLDASSEIAAGLPLVVRMDGMNSEVGQRLLYESRLPFLVKTTMGEAVRSVIKAVKEKR